MLLNFLFIPLKNNIPIIASISIIIVTTTTLNSIEFSFVFDSSVVDGCWFAGSG